MKDYPVVLVAWIDSSSYGSWKMEENFLAQIDKDGLGCESVGYLVREDAARVILAQSRETKDNDRDQISDLIVIPRVAVVSMRRLVPEVIDILDSRALE